MIKSNQTVCELSETTTHTKNEKEKKMRCYLGTGEWTRHVLTIYQQIGHKKKKSNTFTEKLKIKKKQKKTAYMGTEIFTHKLMSNCHISVQWLLNMYTRMQYSS